MRLKIYPRAGVPKGRRMVGQDLAIELDGRDVSSSVRAVEITTEWGKVCEAAIRILPESIEVDGHVLLALQAQVPQEPAED